MASIFQSLLVVLAGANQKELARQLKYLKVENEVLRAKLPARITITPKERQRLLKFGAKLGKALRAMVTIVSPDTFLRWIREEKKSGQKKAPAKRGRRRTPEEIRKLVIKLGRETGWGYTRILGELKKLGVRAITRNTVKNILKEQGLDPGPQRGKGTWDDFLKQHAASLWQCDFLSQKVLTWKGVREVFLIAFIHVKTRRVIVSPATLHPDEAWVVAQGEAFVKVARSGGLSVGQLMHDRDTKFTKEFDRIMQRLRVKVKHTAFRSPNTNAYIERFVQSLQQECLDKFVVFGERHCDVLVREYVEYYLTLRPHQGLDNELLNAKRARGRPSTKRGEISEQIVPLREVRSQLRLGGLLKSYHRAA